MRLFIATTTLNFDSIMSTESLSPSSFYEKREFGIKLFYNKGAFIRKNSILLFDRLPLYNFSESNVEHRPMVVEIDDCNYPEETFEKVAVKNGLTIYRATNTLYISPLSCRIMFKCERDMNITIKRADNFIESKYKAYKMLNAITIIPGEIGVPITVDTFDGIEDVSELNEKALKYDRMVDKAKGFAVSYMIGTSRQLSPSSVKMQRLCKDIKNAIYSLGTQKESNEDNLIQINNLAAEAEELSFSLDPRKQQAEKRLLEFLRNTKPENLLHGSNEVEVLEYIKRMGQQIYEYLMQKVNSSMSVFSIKSCVTKAINAKDDETLEKAIENLREYVMSISKTESGEKHLSNIMSFGIDLNVINSLDKSLTSESQKELGILYNLYTGVQYSSYNINTTRNQYVYDAAVALGIPESEDKLNKDYFNALLDNLEHMAKFDIKKTSDPIMMSLAAFMKAPDVDINKLTSLLVNNEISDMRVAYGLWGLFYGYSKVRQNLFNELLANYKDEQSLRVFVKGLYVAIHKKEPVFPPVQAKEHKHESWPQKIRNAYNEIVEESVIPFPENDGIDGGADKIGTEPKNMHSNVNAGLQNDAIRTSNIGVVKDEVLDDLPSQYADLVRPFHDLIVKYSPRTKQRNFIDYYVGQIDYICSSNDRIVAIKTGINNIPAKYGKSAWENHAKPAILKHLKEIEHDEMNSMVSQRISNTQHETKTQSIISDSLAISLVERFVRESLPNDEKRSKKIIDTFKHFYKEYQPGGYYYKLPDQYERDNKSVIQHWTNWCFSEKNQYQRLSIDLKPIVEQVAKRLNEIYRRG